MPYLRAGFGLEFRFRLFLGRQGAAAELSCVSHQIPGLPIAIC